MNRFILKLPVLIGFGILFFLFIQCRKDPAITTDPAAILGFSNDSIIFDTVFTTVGSVTANLRVYNKNAERIRISDIYLAGGASSTYEINIDGEPAINVKDIEIDSGDSIFIFVRVTVNPNNINSPFVLEDSIMFLTNGNLQAVKLVAWGQNARYIVADTHIEGLPSYKIVAGENETVVWNKELPYVVYGYAVVDSTGLLRIEEGTQIHFHAQSGLWIYKGGCLKVNGTLQEPVVFQGDKLGYDYDEVPGQWDRIWINEGSTDNEIDHAIIKNGFIGIQAETLQEYMYNQLTLTNTVIKNMTGAGIFTRFYLISGFNNVIANCGQYTLALTMGGSYEFAHCTSANFWSESYRPTQSMVFTNYILDEDDNPIVFPFISRLGNSIFTGNMTDEFIFDFKEGYEYTWKFENCLLKTTYNTSDTSHYMNCLVNEDPLFRDYQNNDYHIDTIISPVIGKGLPEISANFPYDLDGVTRAGSPDLGAYQFVPDTSASFQTLYRKHKLETRLFKNTTFNRKAILVPSYNKKIAIN